MKSKKLILISALFFVLAACGTNTKNDDQSSTKPEESSQSAQSSDDASQSSEQSESSEQSKSSEESLPPVPVEPTVTDAGTFDGEAEIYYCVGGYEWGPAVDKAVIEFPSNILEVSSDLFAVTNETTNSMGTAVTNNITVNDAYLSDAKGNAVEGDSKFVTLVFPAKYNSMTPFSYSMTTSKNTWVETFNLNVSLASGKTITLKDTETEYSRYNAFSIGGNLDDTHRIISAERLLKTGTFSDDTYTLQYAAYEPEEMKKDSGKNPLIIWLHGAGEGGTDISIAYLGNDVTNLMEEKIQSHFVTSNLKGAYVAAFQTPTFWMDNGDGENHSGNQPSVYTETLMNAIKKYVSDNGDIDENRIYIGGCSNGGYMTMNMLINHGDYFAAAYPICEAYQDAYLTDEQATALANRNIWFTHSANDTTVAPADFTLATYARLNNLGAKNIYFSYFETVLGTDTPNQSYMGHWSWIYTLQDQCTSSQAAFTDVADVNPSNDGGGNYLVKINNEEVSLWGWLAAQTKGQQVVGVREEKPEPEKPDTPVVPGDSFIFEAEDAEISGTPSSGDTFIETGTVASGGESVGYLSTVGNTVTFKFNSSAAGTAKFVMYMTTNASDWNTSTMSSQDVSSDILKFTLNGEEISYEKQTLKAVDSMTWNSYFDPIDLGTHAIKEGENVFVMEVVALDDSGTVPNIDYLEIISEATITK